MKVSRFFVLSIVLLVMVLAFSMKAEADLKLIGTATYNSLYYNLIYDDDFNITWLDYSQHRDVTLSQMFWAASLNNAGELTYNFNPGVTMTWSGDWRLPTALNQDGSGPCDGYNCDESEWGHLYYTELGNSAGGPLSNTGDFQNLVADFYGYWTSTFSSTGPEDPAWAFLLTVGVQSEYGMWVGKYAIAVRDGLAVTCPNLVRIVDVPPVYYSTLQDAYDNAGDGDTIQSQGITFNEEQLDIDDLSNKSVTFEGGYDCDYNDPPTGITVLNGNMTISKGTFTIESGTFEVL